uniref:Uncharacterized protein n=1 Tax=Ciona savignyi TaxID=51511 RepID=H2Y4Y4_CIOSA
ATLSGVNGRISPLEGVVLVFSSVGVVSWCGELLSGIFSAPSIPSYGSNESKSSRGFTFISISLTAGKEESFPSFSMLVETFSLFT